MVDPDMCTPRVPVLAFHSVYNDRCYCSDNSIAEEIRQATNFSSLHNVSNIFPTEKSRGAQLGQQRCHRLELPQLIHIPVNCSLSNLVTSAHLAGRHTHQVPMAQNISLALRTVTVCRRLWKNGPITPALVICITFNFRQSCSCSLTS
jgi:hypothetical protein